MNHKRTLVCSVSMYAGKPPEGLGWMLESAAYHGIEVDMMCTGRVGWIDRFTCKIVSLYEQTHRLTGYDYVLFVDAADCLLATDLGEILHRFDHIGRPFVMAAERLCYPWPAKYDSMTPMTVSPFRFVNSGGYIATWDAYVNTLRVLIDMDDNGYQEGGLSIKNHDQAAFSRAYVEKQADICVDHECKIFQCLHGLDERWALNQDIHWDKRPFNRHTKTCPCIFHANGPEKWRLPQLRNLLLA
jgi:hypothetical protein